MSKAIEKFGIVTTEHTVWCAASRGNLPWIQNGCEHHYQHAGTARAAQQVARESGWVRTARHGWVCASCSTSIPKE